MNNTNVHSQNDIYCAVAGFIPTEREVEIPPKNAKKGPSTIEVITNQSADIPIFDSELNKNGQLLNKNGELVAKFSKKDTNQVFKKNEKQKGKKVAKSSDKEIR